MSLLGVDVGVTRCIAAAYTVDGERLARSAVAYRPQTGRSGVTELDLQEVWNGLCHAVGQVAHHTQEDPIRALALCATGEGLVVLSQDGRPFGPCLLGVGDAHRASPPARDGPGHQRFFEITGRLPGPHEAVDLICWLKEERPEILARAWRIVPLGAYVVHALGGVTACDYSLAGHAWPLDVLRRAWSRELLPSCVPAKRVLPELLQAGTPVGALSSRAAQDLGLSRATRIVMGAHELCCEALGAGVVSGGDALLDLGASIRMAATFQAIPLTSLMMAEGLGIRPHAVEGLLLSPWECYHGERVLRWFRDHLTPLEKREAQRTGTGVYDLLLSEMPEDPTTLLVLPGCSDEGPEGGQGALLGVTYDTTRGAIVKALLEGVGYQLRGALRAYERAGIGVSGMRAVGGGATSDRWLRICADVLGMPVRRTHTHETGTLGAALLAGMGSGVYGSVEEATTAGVQIDATFEPDAKHHEEYVERANLADEARSCLRDLLTRLSAADR